MALCLYACESTPPTQEEQPTEPVYFRIAFGSCAHQDKAQPMVGIAADKELDAFVFLGDNIYGDTEIMDTLTAKYSRLAAKSTFQKLEKSSPIYSVWDDHDYGENDAGRHYPFKAESKEIFMDFWKVPEDSDRRKHPGIYGVEYLKKGDLTVQLIMLDTRTFRDNLIFREKADSIEHKNDYARNQSPDSTFLGAAQWSWLEETFKQAADVRIIASSNQFSHEYNGWESWTNVPHEQQKMIDLIQKTKANGVVFISGDVHWGEISRLPVQGGYPIYDVTSSGITQTWDIIEPNKNRIGDAVPQNNIGMIDIAKKDGNVLIELSIIDSTANKVVSRSLQLSEISFSEN